MSTVTVADAKARLGQLLDDVERGEEVVITRRGKPVARVSPIQPARQPIDFEAIAALREAMPFQEVPSADIIRQMRDEES